MADRIEREIEEILARLDTDPPEQERGKPVSIASRRKRGPGPGRRAKNGLGNAFNRISATTLLFTGAGVMVAGLIVSSAWGPAIWASFAGVCIFLAAFLASFVRRKPVRGASAAAPANHYWRDRYIEYTPRTPTPFDRFRKRLRKK
jgi:hypothetical protein